MSRTRIVATIGPATSSPEQLKALARAGMSVARLNGSHADLDWHSAAIRTLRSVLPDVPILLDIPGRKIRTVQLAHEPIFATGARIVLTTDTSFDGREKVPVNYSDLHLDLKPGNTILADDGTLRFCVERIEERDIICIAETAGQLRSRKGINVPFVQLRTKLVTERDHKMVAFARDHDLDFIGISFVESAAHVHAIRELVGGSTPQILAKVENQQGLDHVDEIAEAADVIMIDRGDLSVETSLETLAIYQKSIIDSALEHGKPVIVATEMLHSMIDHDFPTKAEVSDITNAILDGCSATMLSGETAVGRYPIQAVELMRRVSDATFLHLQGRNVANGQRQRRATMTQVVEDSIAAILGALPITKVVAITRLGFAARMLSSRAVQQPILAVSDNPRMARAFNLYPGVEGVHSEQAFPRDSANHVKTCLRHLHDISKIEANDMVLVTAAVYPGPETRMNLIEIHQVSDVLAIT